MKKQQGFTSMKLAIGIVALILLVVWFSPKSLDLDDARLTGVSGAITAVMSNNSELCSTLNHSSKGSECKQIENCNDATKLLLNASLPEGYAIEADRNMTENGETLICTLIHTSSNKTANFTAIAAGLQ